MLTHLIKSCTPMHLKESQNHGQKKLYSTFLHARLLMNSYILYKLTVAHPKTRLEFIKDVIDSLASDYKEIMAFSVASNHGIANLPGKKEKDCIVCSNWNNPAIGRKRSRTVCTKCAKGVHAKCSLKHKYL